MAWSKEDKSFKTLINKRSTSSTKNFYEEIGDFTINVNIAEVWTETVPATPEDGVLYNVAQEYTLFTLTEDTSVANQQCYYAYSGGSRLKNWISDKYGDGYKIRLFQNNNTEIFPTNPSNWIFDYQTGILTFSGSTASFAKPFKITGYRYIGPLGKSGISNPEPGDVWEIVTCPQQDWSSICYGNGLFVAIAYTESSTSVMTSPDGINWTSRTTPSDINLAWVCYGGGLFVAVAYGGTGNHVITSPDGITWTSRVAASNNNWTSVCYGKGLFVAVAASGTNNRVMTSPDGINWTSRTSAANNWWTSVCYGNGLFVAVSQDGTNCVMTSPDGITWTLRTSASNNWWTSVCYGNGLFVAVAYAGSDCIMTSSNGISWTAMTPPKEGVLAGVCYGNGLFVIVYFSENGLAVLTSLDGVNWVAKNQNLQNHWVSICYGDGIFVAVSYDGTGNQVMVSGSINAMNFPETHSHNKINGGLTVTGDVILSDDVKVYGDMNATGMVSLGAGFTGPVSMGSDLSIAGGVVVGNPTGGNKGPGTINATAYYDDNTPVTGYVLDKFFNKDSFDIAIWDKKANKTHLPARAFVDKADIMYDIDKFNEYLLRNKCLPAFEEIELNNKQGSLGEMVQKLWETVEVQAVHIKILNEKNKVMEQQIKNLMER